MNRLETRTLSEPISCCSVSEHCRWVERAERPGYFPKAYRGAQQWEILAVNGVATVNCLFTPPYHCLACSATLAFFIALFNLLPAKNDTKLAS